MLAEQEEKRKFRTWLTEKAVEAKIKAGTSTAGLPAQNQLLQQAMQSRQAGRGQEQEMDWKMTVDSTGKQTITLEPKKQKVLSPRDQLTQDIIQSQSGLSAAQATPSSAFAPQAQSILGKQLPQTPFVSGPEGGFVTGRRVEAMPSSIVPRPQVIGGLAPGLAPQLRQDAITQARGRLGQLENTAMNLNRIGLSGAPGMALGSVGGDYASYTDEELANLAEQGDREALAELRQRGIIQ